MCGAGREPGVTRSPRGLFLNLYDALVARFGVAADERFATVLNGITKERQRRKRQQYNAAYRARPRTDPEVVAARLARAAYMRDYRSRRRTEEEVQAAAPGEGGVPAGGIGRGCNDPCQGSEGPRLPGTGLPPGPAWSASTSPSPTPSRAGAKGVLRPGHRARREDGEDVDSVSLEGHKMYTYTIKTEALAVEIEASTIDAAAVMFGRSAGLSGDNCQEVLESVSGIVGAWMWIESDDAPDGDRRGGSSPEVLQEYLAEVAAREEAENPPRLKILYRAQADTVDYTIAYIDGEPVAIVEESDGGFYGVVADGEYVDNLYEQRRWYVEGGKWSNAFAQRNALVDKIGYTLREINDGNQEVYDGRLDEAFAD